MKWKVLGLLMVLAGCANPSTSNTFEAKNQLKEATNSWMSCVQQKSDQYAKSTNDLLAATRAVSGACQWNWNNVEEVLTLHGFSLYYADGWREGMNEYLQTEVPRRMLEARSR